MNSPTAGGVTVEPASSGSLEVLQWVHDEGCPSGKGTCEKAVEGGHLEMLTWAKANGCPWQPYKVSSLAAKGEHFYMLHLVRDHVSHIQQVLPGVGT